MHDDVAGHLKVLESRRDPGLFRDQVGKVIPVRNDDVRQVTEQCVPDQGARTYGEILVLGFGGLQLLHRVANLLGHSGCPPVRPLACKQPVSD
ncbi:hypothetical protein D3C71_1421200 [compost metagenome]